jgi:hypothetical protein
MRKSKDIKRKRKTAGTEYRKGNRQEAYKLWNEAAKEYATLREQRRATKEDSATAAETA